MDRAKQLLDDKKTAMERDGQATDALHAMLHAMNSIPSPAGSRAGSAASANPLAGGTSAAAGIAAIDLPHGTPPGAAPSMAALVPISGGVGETAKASEKFAHAMAGAEMVAKLAKADARLTMAQAPLPAPPVSRAGNAASANPPADGPGGGGGDAAASDRVIARPPGSAGSAPTTDEWFEKNIWQPLKRRGLPAEYKEKLRGILHSGCIGMAALTTSPMIRPDYPGTQTQMPGYLPDVSLGFKEDLKAAEARRDYLNRHNPVQPDGATLSGQPPRWRIFALLYSSKNETLPTAEPTAAGDGSYNLNRNDVMATILDRSKPGATNFDFFTLSQPGDPWYNQDRPWVHADSGGSGMSLKATTQQGIEREKAHNHSDFDRLFYFVARERQFPVKH
jgi:hypothetical protein